MSAPADVIVSARRGFPMSAFLTVDRLAAAQPDGAPLFSGLTLALGREVVGLVGRNGAGKSTLLAILAGEREAAAGSVTRNAAIAMLRQVQSDDRTVAQALGVAGDLTRLARLEAGEGTPRDAELADWTLEERLAAAFARVHLTTVAPDRPVASLSGGERTRLGLAAMLLGEPEVLLMDEPTNNLDVEGRAAIAELLRDWPGGAIVASHDRELLESVDRIVQLSPVGIVSFGGGWTAFAAARDAMRERAGAELDRATRDARQQALAVQRQAERKTRRDKAGRLSAARGSEPRIVLGAQAERAQNSGGRGARLAERLTEEAGEALETARRQVEVVTPLRIELPPAHLPANRTLLRFADVVLEREGRRLFGPLSFTITGRERVRVGGANGSGKTSLLRLAMGFMEPTSGAVTRAQGALAMLDQHAELLDPSLDLVANLRARHPSLTAREAHEVLARFAFRNRDALRPAATLSGGEALRAGLAMVSGGPVAPQLLILDEPTNHLDIDAVEMLERALADWDGALLLVSHDRRFCDAVGFDREIALGLAP
jgi:ATPase subunit of ABC transporter with duplicated ATPase domains